jgi:hypothetical protein
VERDELVIEPSRPARNAITESDLIRGYSGLARRRSTVETVRADLATADEAEDAGGPTTSDEHVPAQDAGAEAARR